MGITSLFNQTISLYNKSSYDDEGREVVGSATSVRCRFQRTSKRRLLPNGTLLTIDAIVYIPGTTSINTDDKVTFAGVNYKVIGRYDAIGANGVANHIKLEVVKWQT